MMLPLFWLYICRRAARVVRKAPSRWMESSFFHFANSNSTSGATIWTPALLIRMSRRPKVSITRAMPASTCSSLLTSMATPSARCSSGWISRGRFLRRLLIEIRDHHLCPLAGEGERNLLADAARGAGDQGNLVHKPALPGGARSGVAGGESYCASSWVLPFRW